MKKIKLISVLFLSIATNSCSEAQGVSSKETTTVSKSNFAKNVTAKEFQKLTQKEGSIIDVRTPQEFNAGYIKGAKNINIYDDNFSNKVGTLDKTKPVYLYCKSGGRSGKAMKKMKELGFTKLYNLIGGFDGWSGKGLSFEK